ncbi:GNAT family N-acetyltransferase [Arthrobacter zhaoxinii]|uniref:GNAT family N-acetyltransferase n=1 Tax=Arthrobacter zhaoxinii TaxID=2964616 RepID=UPI002102261C|nr:GNAT family N-acetyltransferase [Arthrobacter zhaoxinii]MCQ2001057.1 GNAT family N-acetyltransferase [Arthrobacter zhaoxinii]
MDRLEREDELRPCRDYARRLGAIRLVAIIHPENTASRRVAEKIGMSFELTATDGGQERSVFGFDIASA